MPRPVLQETKGYAQPALGKLRLDACARENGRPVRAIAGHLPDDHRFSFSRKDGMDVGVRRPPGTFNRSLTAAPECRWSSTQVDLPPPRFNPQ